MFSIGPLQQFFLINSCFSSSSINARKKFWGVPHLLHMFVILSFMYLFLFGLKGSLWKTEASTTCTWIWEYCVFYLWSIILKRD